mmetsp:Transcript_30102/g.87408  ORF Transcript_30102/g.87408 Transcript_30102/m.87408 type:complete len:203 (-) Transcript_30102:64-672(-)
MEIQPPPANCPRSFDETGSRQTVTMCTPDDPAMSRCKADEAAWPTVTTASSCTLTQAFVGTIFPGDIIATCSAPLRMFIWSWGGAGPAGLYKAVSAGCGRSILATCAAAESRPAANAAAMMPKQPASTSAPKARRRRGGCLCLSNSSSEGPSRFGNSTEVSREPGDASALIRYAKCPLGSSTAVSRDVGDASALMRHAIARW